MGADSLNELHTWKDPERILRACTVVVFSRTDVPNRMEVGGEASLIVFESPIFDVSSTEIREKVRNGQNIDSLVPDAVRDYIAEHALYAD